VLANDTDVDTGTTLSVTKVNGNAASVGSAITLASGAKVTMKADGSYTVDTNGKYGSLASGEKVTESFSYTVSDGAGGSATGKATVTITGTNDAPTAQGTIAAETAREGDAFTRKVPADLFADIDTSDKLTLSADLTSGAALPGWLKFDTATGTFSGTPTGSDTGTITVRVTATDPSGASASTSFALKIEEAPKAVTQGDVAPITTTTVTSTPVVVTAAPSLVILPLFESNSSSTDKTDTTSSSSTRTVTSSTVPAANSDVSVPNTVTIAASQSWMVSVGTSGVSDTGGLRVLNPVADQRLGTDAASSFRLPSGVFAHSDKDAIITIKATLADGSPLPKWLKFDATSGTFSGTPPAGEKGKLDIKITARDKSGSEAVVKFKLSTTKSGDATAADQPETPTDGQRNIDAARPRDHQTAHAPLPGRPSLTAQVKAAGRDGFMAEGLALLESLLKAAGIDDADKAA
jgi:VCBS repeat-containing protein